jgi:hypothetical protein
MQTLPALMLVTYTDPKYVMETKTLVAPCNLYAALGKILNNDYPSSSWKITIEPTKMEYFTGDEQ